MKKKLILDVIKKISIYICILLFMFLFNIHIIVISVTAIVLPIIFFININNSYEYTNKNKYRIVNTGSNKYEIQYNLGLFRTRWVNVIKTSFYEMIDDKGRYDDKNPIKLLNKQYGVNSNFTVSNNYTDNEVPYYCDAMLDPYDGLITYPIEYFYNENDAEYFLDKSIQFLNS